MQTKRNTNRKQKRQFKKLLMVSGVFVGFVSLFVGIVFFIIHQQTTQKHYISPLATISFLQHGTSDTKLIALQKELTKRSIAYSTAQKTKEGSYVVKLKEGGIVTFSAQKDIMMQIASLQYVLSHLTMEGKLFTRLDLRFEKPVIVLQ